MTEKEKMCAGQLYLAQDPELLQGRERARDLTRRFNLTECREERESLLRELFASAGEGIYIEPPFRCDYGSNISVGDGFYANYDCIILDVCRVKIGDHVLFGPRVGVYTATHPIDAAVRDTGLEYGREIVIGNSVWIGGGTVINPGVTIGDGAVIGSGSVVTRDIPGQVIAAGNPCRVLREITEKDRREWELARQAYLRGGQEDGPSGGR